MKQLLQNLETGAIELLDVPVPTVGRGQVLIRSHSSVISAGTERMLNSFATANYLNKARQQPERVRDVLNKAQTDGVMNTIAAVQGKLSVPIPLGYSNAGTVLAVGSGVTDLAVGDRVVSNGSHAEVVAVPRNLVARVPDNVDFDSAAFTVIASIALQGVRLINPTIGERVAVFGLGLVGLLAVQILRANGCKVLAFDFVEDRLALATKFGATAHNLGNGVDPVLAAAEFTQGEGIDGVLVAASTSSDEPIRQAAQMSRQRGRIVLTGVVGLNLRREDFYEKELQFSVSCSYGPGRYDSSYEIDGHDYPIGFVRWTEQRNFEAVLGLMSDGLIDVASLATSRNDFSAAGSAYTELQNADSIGIILQYDTGDQPEAILATTAVDISSPERNKAGVPVVAVIGAGSFSLGVLLPALTETPVRLKYIVSSRGTSGSVAASKFGIERSTTDNEVVFEDPEVDLVVVSTRHNSHARFVQQGLSSGKAVFVEKPLAINREELASVAASHGEATAPWLMVGFNRRFAPTTEEMRQAMAGRQGPASAVFIANAGALPHSHWTKDPAVGGGRIIGEACHYIDYLCYLIGAPVVAVSARSASGAQGLEEDNTTIQLSFADGSIGTIHYFSSGSKAVPKERCEVFFDGKVLQMDNFKSVKAFGISRGRPKLQQLTRRQDKGHREQFDALVEALRSGEASPICFEELSNVTDASFAAVESLRSGGDLVLVSNSFQLGSQAGGR